MAKRSFFTSSLLAPMAVRWHAARAARPWLPTVVTLLALNLAYFAWSQGVPVPTSERVPQEINPSAMVLLTPEEGQRREARAQAQTQAAARAKTAPVPDMLLEYETTPAKEIPPDR
jgi:hypothetical protein